MNKKEQDLLNGFQSHDDFLREQLKNDDYAALWLNDLLHEYSETKNVNELVYNLRPLIEAKHTICEFSKIIGIHRITLYKIFSGKMIPSIDILHKIFWGLGYKIKLSASKV